ncbi:MAG: 50S ribosome-binding GTPase [Planctomycetaceae bacterium]|nr:50S ribosome-binding GTPase [Planctomycetaceae bacterium]
MAANLTPQYKKAEDRYKAATTDEERLDALEEMLREIPKHKASEHMQADIKRKMSKLKAAMESGGSKKGAPSHVDIFHVPRGGAGQVVLIGMPNSGKSSILAALTKAPVVVAEYPYATDKPIPGMALYEDVPIQLVDTPPITADFAPSGLVNTCRGADLLAVVIDLSGDVLEQMDVCTKYLDSHRLMLKPGEEHDPAAQHMAHKTFVVATKSDLAPAGTLDTLKELADQPLDYIEISSETRQGLDTLMKTIYDLLHIVRIYAKRPGKEPDMRDPFTLKKGSTVHDLAVLIHRELADKLKSARSWHAPGVHDGQNVPREHILSDKEIIELHFA